MPTVLGFRWSAGTAPLVLCMALAAPASARAQAAPGPSTNAKSKVEAKALLTVAERSDYRATARHGEIVAWCRAFEKAAPNARLTELGRTVEGRSVPLLIVADPPVETPEEAARSGKLVCLIVGGIHAGEACGKEALPMLLRDELAAAHPPLLKGLVLAVVPLLNADGNERVSQANRPEQDGPADGMGQRANARGLDLNRDFMKLETPEVRALVKFANAWKPHLFIDTHTTDGSRHRYIITYEGPKNPVGDANIIRYQREKFFPEAARAFKARTGLDAFVYGNFSGDRTRWTSYPAAPRFGTTYFGLRGCLTVLSEAYSHAPFKARVLATRDFVLSCLETAAKSREEIVKRVKAARRPASPGPGPMAVALSKPVPIRTRPKAASNSKSATVAGFEERRDEQGKLIATDVPADYRVAVMNEFEAAESVSRPFAYLVPARCAESLATLKRHGIDVRELLEDVELDLEVYRVGAVERAPRRSEGHRLVELKVERRAVKRLARAGSFVARASGPLGTLAVLLLEPRSEDGLAAWGAFDGNLAAGAEFPVARLPRFAPLLAAPAGPPPEDQPPPRPVAIDELLSGPGSGRGPGFALGTGRPVGAAEWIDGAHWLGARSGRLFRIDSDTGRARPFANAPALVKALTKLPSIDEKAARDIANPTHFHMSPDHRGFLFERHEDLYYAAFDGSIAARLTNAPGRELCPKFSPDGARVAFARDFDLYVVDVPSRGGEGGKPSGSATERRLTTGGRDDLRHGVSDWVYFEEVWDRNWPAFWWSPDSKSIAFFETDDANVPFHTVLDDASSPTERRVERARYPRSGEPNPKVRLGVVSAAGGAIVWADLAGYSAESSLITQVGWRPRPGADGPGLDCQVQDRAQTWLDLVDVDPKTGAAHRLFRDSTRAWITSPGPAHPYLKDTFLWLSERDGWKHIYQYDEEGKLVGRLTSGPWEVRRLAHVDRATGWVYFEAARDQSAPMANALYRVKPGSSIERLTPGPGAGTCAINMAPDGRRFIAVRSGVESPESAALYRCDGQFVRTVDIGARRAWEQFQFGPRERIQVPARDGHRLEAQLILPVEMRPGRRYPVWFMTYGGPHTPTISEGWQGGRLRDHALAGMGLVVFRMDPRTASGKGASSAWNAYKHLGVQELRDIEDAVEWLKKKPYVDASRIGMAGHSYGGYITAYAMAHCDLFAAGIAGAPVTDWRDYDSIYTERFMGLPQDNPDGYKASSVVEAAGKLHGRLLVLHGAIDDNVSMRNTMRLVQALQRADKDFELMIYPSSRHGIYGPHYNRLQIDFIRRALKLDRGACRP